MKAFKSFGLVLALALGSWGCESDDDSAFDPAHLPGTWIHAEKDGQAVPADDRFVSIYRADGTETYAIRGSANHWTETAGYAYAVGGRTIAVAGHGTQLEYDVLELSASRLVYRVSRLVVGGQDLEDTSVYVLRKPPTVRTSTSTRRSTAAGRTRRTTAGAISSTATISSPTTATTPIPASPGTLARPGTFRSPATPCAGRPSGTARPIRSS